MHDDDSDREWRRYWLMTAAVAAFTAIVTAGANAVAEELQARWRAQRERRREVAKKEPPA